MILCHMQIDGVDFFNIFAPVVQWATGRLLLNLSITLKLATVQVNYVSASLISSNLIRPYQFSRIPILTDIKEKDGDHLKVYTNEVSQVSKMVGSIKEYGEVWYNTESLANILSLAQVRLRCRVTMDTSVEACMTNKWRILRNRLSGSQATSAKIVVCCATLHNYLTSGNFYC